MHWASVTGPNVVLEWTVATADMELRGVARSLPLSGLAQGSRDIITGLGKRLTDARDSHPGLAGAHGHYAVKLDGELQDQGVRLSRRLGASRDWL